MRLLTKLILIYFGVELAIFLGVSSVPVNNPGMAQVFSSTVSSTDSLPYVLLFLTIFSHNLSIALVEFIPVIGVGMMLLSIGDTAYVLTSYTTTVLHFPGIFAALALLTLPHSWLELPSYAVAAGAGTYAVWKRDWVRSLLMVPFVALELFLAAVVEAAEISFPSDSYLMWIPGAAAIVGLIFLYEYIQKVSDSYQRARTPVGYQGYQPYQPSPQSTIQQQVNSLLFNAQSLENQGRFKEAMDSYWDAVLLLVREASAKYGLLPVTLQDYFNAVNLLGQRFSPDLPSLFQGAYNSRLQGNFAEFKQYAIPMVFRLKGILGIS